MTALLMTALLTQTGDLPELLVAADGEAITTVAQWEKRRAELERLLRENVYGDAPPAPEIGWHAEVEAPVLDGKASRTEVEIRFPHLPPNAPKIHLLLYVPADADGPVPVFLALNKGGNQTVAADPDVRVSESWVGAKTETTRGSQADFWCVEQILGRGYGFATFHQSDVDPDRDDFTDGIHPFYPELRRPNGWGTIAAWAWGLQRAADYLTRNPDVGRLAVIGHSRRGKTALLAGATDERFALVVPHQSGTGGMALSRGNDQETVRRINASFPHWFSDSFVDFGGREEDLPIDQHMLAALVAPRLLLDTEGARDAWANPDAALRTLRAAAPAWELSGGPALLLDRPLTAADPIAADTAGRLVQVRLDKPHTLDADYWRAILDYADLRLRPGQ